MALNGQLDRASLSLVDGWALLESNTARAWNAACAHMVRLGYPRPTITAPDGAYRDLAGQTYWKAYWTAQGKPYNAATPGYSNHGWGKAVDIYKVYIFPRDTLRAVFGQYGFTFNVASEPWHCTHNGLKVASTTGTQITEENDMADITRDQMQQIAIVLLDTNIATAVGVRSVKQALSDALLFGKATADGIRHIPLSVWGHELNRPDATNDDGTPKTTSAGDLLRYEPAEHQNTRKTLAGADSNDIDVPAILEALKALPAETVAALKAAL